MWELVQYSSNFSKTALTPGRNIASYEATGYWGYYIYLVSRIAGEVAVFDSQGPVVHDRSAKLGGRKFAQWGGRS